MKNFLLLSFIFLLSVVGFTQKLEVKFDQYIYFQNKTTSTDYFKVMNEDSIEITSVMFGLNKYIIDLNKKTIEFYSLDKFVRKSTIQKVEKNESLIVLTINDEDSYTNNPIFVYIVINNSIDTTDHPYFTFYYETDGMIKGYMVIDNIY